MKCHSKDIFEVLKIKKPDFELKPRMKINNLYKKETIMYQHLDLLEKIVRLSELQSVIATMEVNLSEFVKKNNNKEKAEEVQSMIDKLKETENYLYLLFEQGLNSERYAFEATKDNLNLRFEIEKLKKELEVIKLNISI